MKKYLSIIFVLSLTLNTFVVAQESEGDEAEISTVEALLQLVKEGKTKEQSANADREAKFMANKNEQAAILAAEKRELARQERIADQLEAEYKAKGWTICERTGNSLSASSSSDGCG